MIKKAIQIFTALMLGLLIASCEKIEPEVILGEGASFKDTMDDIPLQYGRLVTTTSHSKFIKILWFEQVDQTIVAVRVNTSNGTIKSEVIRFERK
jgi:hypothetical protein